MPAAIKFSVTPAIVLCISGHDPSGGAGLQADIESINACGGFANTVPSCLTIQNHRHVQHIQQTDCDYMRAALDCLVSEATPAGIKIGLLGHEEQAFMLAEWLNALPGSIPVVLDPVIRASDGSELSQQTLVNALRSQLLPLTHLLTPNHDEARQLAETSEMPEAMQRLLQTGCKNILLTGGDETSDPVCNRLYAQDLQLDWDFPRLAGSFHGSGCTLAAAAASYLAQGFPVAQACERALNFTQHTLMNALKLDDGPCLPCRSRP